MQEVGQRLLIIYRLHFLIRPAPLLLLCPLTFKLKITHDISALHTEE